MAAGDRPRVERRAAGYPWRKRFPHARRVTALEGGAVYAAEGEGAYWLIKDEGTMADSLDPDEDADLLASLVALERYADHGAFAAAIMRIRNARAAALDPGGSR